MNKLYLFALLVAVASANLAADMSNYLPSRQTMKCLSSRNVSKVLIELSNEMGGINQDFLNGYIFARDSGISTVDAIVMVNDTFIANSFSSNIANVLPSGFNGTIWLQIINSPQLWTQDMSKRISYLENLVFFFKQHGMKVGISADVNAWISVFGSQRAGSETLKYAPVWYANENGVQSFDDFSYAGFGTWTQPTLKNFQSHAFICDTFVASLNFYKTETQFNNFYKW